MNFPDLTLSRWQATRDTIWQYARVIGEIRASLSPATKHWWHINLRPDVNGLATPPIPYTGADFFNFKILMNFMNKKLIKRIKFGKKIEKL